jgi:O-antigen/teichoic acid export membrane protein
MKQEDSKQIYSKIFTYHMLLMISIGLVISTFLPEILSIFVSSEFFDVAKYIPLVVFSMVIFSSHRHMEFGILASKKTKYLAYINVTISVVSLILNYFLISSFGIWGAIWSTVTSLSLQSLLFYYFSNKHYTIPFEFKRILVSLLLAGIFYLFSTQIGFEFIVINLSLKIVLICLFPVVLILLKIIKWHEVLGMINIFRQILCRIFGKNKQFKPSGLV